MLGDSLQNLQNTALHDDAVIAILESLGMATSKSKENPPLWGLNLCPPDFQADNYVLTTCRICFFLFGVNYAQLQVCQAS